MARTVTWTLAGLALVAAAVFVVFDRGAESPGRDPLDLDEAPDEAADVADAPALIGTGREPTVRTAPGRFVITGRVVDEEGKPKGDVAVAAFRTGAAWNQRDPASWNRTAAERVARSLAALDDPRSDQPPLSATARSGADGRFRLELQASARYEVHAQPAPPLFGTYATVSVHADQPEADTTLRVLAGSPLHGRVLDEHDAPVAALLRATWWQSEGGRYRRWTSRPIEAAPADGAFRIEAVPAGTVRFAVYLSGGRKLTGIRVKTPHEGELVIRVPAGGGSVEGAVADPAGRPIAGAQVMLGVRRTSDGGGDTTYAKARSDAAGRYCIAGLPDGSLTRVEALADGFLPLSQSGEDAPWSGLAVGGEQPARVDLTLHRGGQVHGRVLVRDGGAPIPGARVRLLPAQRQRGLMVAPLSPAETDARGRYAFAAVPKGRYLLLPEHADHYLPELDRRDSIAMPANLPGAAAPASLTVVITSDASDIERDLRLAPGLPVAGRVVDAAGAGVAGADIQARGFGISQVAWTWGVGAVSASALASSGPDGRFEIRGLPPRDDWVLYARKKGFVGTYSEPFALAEGARAPSIELRLAQGAVLRGRVVGADEEELANAQVSAWGQDSALSAGSNAAKPEPDGRFELVDVPPGDCTINVWLQGRAGVQQAVKGLKAGEVREGLVLEMAQGVVVAGTLVDESGQGVRGVSLILRSLGGGSMLSTTTDAEGAFRFEGASAGRVQLFTWDMTGGQRDVGKPFDAPKTDLRIVYERDPIVIIKGQVLDPEGKPVALCAVKVTAAAKAGERGAQPTYFGMPQGTEAVNGAFRQRVAGKGPYTVSVSHARDEEGRPLNVEPAEQIVTDPDLQVVIRLKPGLAVTGRVLDPEGKGLAGATVTTGTANAQTDSSGRFTLTGLKKGEVVVQVRPPKGYVRPPWQRVAAGTADLEFRLEAGLKIRGQALGPDDKPLSRGYVNGAWEQRGRRAASSVSASLGTDGRFTLDGIPSDVLVRVRVHMWSTTGDVAFAPAIVDDVPPGTDDLVVRIGAGLAIQGTVVDHRGRPASGCHVHGTAVDDEGIRTGYVLVDAEGRWTLAGLEARRYRITVFRQDGGAVPTPVEVDAPASGVRLVLPESASLHGRIEGLDPVTATRWRVRIWRADGSTAATAKVTADGTWRADDLAAGTRYRLGAQYWRDNRYAAAGPLRAGPSEVVLKLKEGRRILGVVDRTALDDDEGVAISAKSATWRAAGQVNKETGRFEINGLPPGRYEVTARTYDSSHVAGRTDVEAGVENLRLVLEAR